MDQKDQERIVNELCASIRDGIVQKIRTGNVPVSWDGHQLRLLVEQHAKEYAERSRRALGRKGIKDFNNDVAVNNL